MNKQERDNLAREIQRLVEESTFELFDLRIGQDRSVHVVIDRPVGRVSVDEIARFNRFLRYSLQESNVDVDLFSIEVESPGAMRPLREPRHYARFHGERARVVRRGENVEPRVVTGLIESSDENGVRIHADDGTDYAIAYRDISEARLDPKLPF